MALLLTIDKSPIPNFDEPQKKPGNRRKSSLKECIFDNMARYFDCRINKTHFYRLLFRRFCPLGSFGIFWWFALSRVYCILVVFLCEF